MSQKIAEFKNISKSFKLFHNYFVIILILPKKGMNVFLSVGKNFFTLQNLVFKPAYYYFLVAIIIFQQSFLVINWVPKNMEAMHVLNYALHTGGKRQP